MANPNRGLPSPFRECARMVVNGAGSLSHAVTAPLGLPRLISIRGHHLVSDLLNENSVVVDLGAHLGEFSSEVNLRFGATCYGAEPNPSLWSKISQTDTVRTFNCAISGTTGPMSFEVSTNPEGSRLRAGGHTNNDVISIESLTLADFIRAHDIPKIDLLKVDIEGAEFDLFESLPDDLLTGVGQITIEFHDFIPELACGPQVTRTKARLERLGFGHAVFSKTSNSDVLFVNRRAYPGTPLSWFYLEKIARYTRGVARVADRWVSGSGE